MPSNPTHFGRAKISTLMRDVNALRESIRREGSPAVQDAWDKCERWVPAVFSAKEVTPVYTPYRLPDPLPFCRDCGKHVKITAFGGGDEFVCALCHGESWYWDNSPSRLTNQDRED